MDIMVIGIVAKNGILLLDADERFRAEEQPKEVMMRRAALSASIVMIAIAAVRMLPLDFSRRWVDVSQYRVIGGHLSIAKPDCDSVVYYF